MTRKKMKGRNEERVDVSKGKSITGLVTGRKEEGGTNNREGGRTESQRPGRCYTEELL